MVINTRLTGWAVMLLASSTAMAQGIYICVDGKGRKITSDRPIAECADRTQHEITPIGTVKRVIGPTLTAQERAAQDEKDKLAAERRVQEQEERRRERALLLRYPNQPSHDKERAVVLAHLGEVIKASAQRTQELLEQHKALQTEMEFYKKDPTKAPAALKRRLEENDNSLLLQKRFLADQDYDRQRINARFDEELLKLRQLWSLAGVADSRALPSEAPGKPAATNKN